MTELAPPADFMEVDLAVVPQCPHQAAAEALLHQALVDIGAGDVSVQTITISDDDTAERLGFRGSPSFMVNGLDVLATTGPPAVSCRIYQTPNGPSGLPALADLRQGLKRALDRPKGSFQQLRAAGGPATGATGRPTACAASRAQ